MEVILIIAFALFGTAIGSFLNVCIDRLPMGRSLLYPSSHCEICQHPLSPKDLIPVFSYIWLHGRCRYCQAHIPLRLPVIEATTALLFSLLYWKFGFGLELGISLVYTSLLIVIFVIDLENQLVLNKITYPAMALAFALSFFWPGVREVNGLGAGTINQAVSSVAGEAVGGAVLSLAGGVLGLIAMALPFIIYPSGMGFGDVKLGALVGLMTGYPLVIIAMLLSWIGGGLVAAILLVFKIKSRKDPIPSATFMAASALVTLLWGPAIWEWYL